MSAESSRLLANDRQRSLDERALNYDQSGTSRGRPTLRKRYVGNILRENERVRKRERQKVRREGRGDRDSHVERGVEREGDRGRMADILKERDIG